MTLWKLTCLKSSGKALKGMTIEVITNSGSPSSDEISKAVNRKYGIESSPFNIISANWQAECLS